MNSQSPSGSSATLPLVASEDSTLSAVGSQTIVEEDESDLLEDEIKSRLIAKILELEEKTSELGMKTADILKDNAKLKSGNDVLTQYIENLLASSSLFQKIGAEGQKPKP